MVFWVSMNPMQWKAHYVHNSWARSSRMSARARRGESNNDALSENEGGREQVVEIKKNQGLATDAFLRYFPSLSIWIHSVSCDELTPVFTTPSKERTLKPNVYNHLCRNPAARSRPNPLKHHQTVFKHRHIILSQNSPGSELREIAGFLADRSLTVLF